MRPVWALPLVAVIVLLPIGAFTGAFAQLTLALCGSPLDPSSSGAASGSWFCSSSLWATFLRNLITAVAPSLLLSLYHMIVLPVLVYYAAQMEGQEASLSGLDRVRGHPPGCCMPVPPSLSPLEGRCWGTSRGTRACGDMPDTCESLVLPAAALRLAVLVV